VGLPRALRVIGALSTAAILPLSVGDPPSDGPAARVTTAVMLGEVAKPASRYLVGTPIATPAPTAAPARQDAVSEPAPNCLVLRCVALTFDDGPVADTQRLLSMLATDGVRATFFTVGEMVTDHPEMVRAEVAAGDEVGNHSWSHPQLTHLSDSAVRSQVERTAQAIEDAGAPRPTLFRPPYGAIDARVRTDLAAEGVPAILWSVDTLDWLHRDPNSVYRRAVNGVRPGSVVLMHDIHPTTVTAVPRIIATLKERGYTFVTVSELYGDELKPGVAYEGREDEWTAAQHRPTDADTTPAPTQTPQPDGTPTPTPTDTPVPAETVEPTETPAPDEPGTTST
jgi:peptidoglycan/xylan/chitin deacetylase (PgdA/CDA1 family)